MLVEKQYIKFSQGSTLLVATYKVTIFTIPVGTPKTYDDNN